ncbi:efflux RND transporter permease subunit [Escherichia coli]
MDDAIVVVRKHERVMAEGLPPKEATRNWIGPRFQARSSVSRSCFPRYPAMAFFGGSTGAIYRQFSITIVAAMALSVAGGADLWTPALCATMLNPSRKAAMTPPPASSVPFNRMLDKAWRHYTIA